MDTPQTTHRVSWVTVLTGIVLTAIGLRLVAIGAGGEWWAYRHRGLSIWWAPQDSLIRGSLVALAGLIGIYWGLVGFSAQAEQDAVGASAGGAPDRDAGEPVACIRCGAVIRPGSERCADCGWTYAAEADAQPENPNGIDPRLVEDPRDPLSMLGETQASFTRRLRRLLGIEG